MNKSEFIDKVAEQTGIAHSMLDVVLGRTLHTIESALAEGEQVAIHGFGIFSTKTRKARQGRNPRTGETIDIAQSRIVAFKSAKNQKSALNR